MKYRVLTILLIAALISCTLPLFNPQFAVKANPTIINVPTDYSTITAAIAAASPGDTILVNSGTYNESVNINKSLLITSLSGPSSTIIDGTNVILASPGLVKITAPGDVTFSGFTVRHTPAAGGVTFGILSQSSVADVTYTISNNIIYGSNNVSNDQEYGFYSQQDRANVIFTRNRVTQTGSNDIVFEVHTGKTEISHNTLDAGVYGIDSVFMMTYDGHDVSNLQNVSYNTFNMGTGAAFDYEHRASAISINTPGAAYGVGDAQFTNVLIQNNIISNLMDYGRGIGFWNGGGGGGGIIGPVVEDNTITGTGASHSYGIDFIATGSSPIAAQNAIIVNNVISKTGYGIILRTDGCAPGAQIYYNNIAGNTVGLDNTVGTSAVEARFNWWGDPTGPYNPTSNPSGLGNAVTDNVTYQPYQTSAVPTTFSPALFQTVIAKGADRLVSLQSATDYGWDWVVDGEPPWTGTSATNLYGVTALSLIDAYLATGNSTYLTTAENAGNFMMYGDPSNGDFYYGHGAYSWGYSSDYRFLMELSTVTGNVSIANYALAAWAWQKANRGQHYGDGNQSALYDYLVNDWVGPGYYGLGAWQASDFGLAAYAMGDTSWANGMAAVINSNIPNILASYATNYTFDYIDMGMAWGLKLLVTVDPVTYAAGIVTLTTQLLNNQLCDGSWDFGSNFGESQTTAYVVIGLTAAGQFAAARRGADWLAATQLPNGGWEGSPSEYSEVDSEVIQALALRAQLTVTSAHDSPVPTSTSYLVGTSVTASITSPVAGPAGTQYVCTGWTGTGDVPASGTETHVTFTLNQDSSITWNWKTQYFLTLATNPPSVDTPTGSGWCDAGSNRIINTAAYVTITPGILQYRFTNWTTGDMSEITDSSATLTTVNMDQAKTVTANYVTEPQPSFQAPVVQMQRLNKQFNVNITISNLNVEDRTIGLQFRLCYNDTLLQLVNITEGPFMQDPRWNLQGTFFTSINENSPIYGPNIIVGILLLPNGTGIWNAFPYGNGVIATLTFTALMQQTGLSNPPLTCNLHLVQNLVVNDNGDEVLSSATDGLFKMLPTNIADINHDYTVDMRDLGIAARAFGTDPSWTRWNPIADITGPHGVPDGKVDMRDIALIAKNFGWTALDP